MRTQRTLPYQAWRWRRCPGAFSEEETLHITSDGRVGIGKAGSSREGGRGEAREEEAVIGTAVAAGACSFLSLSPSLISVSCVHQYLWVGGMN